MRLYGYTVVRLCGYAVVRLYGYAVVRLCGCTVIRITVSISAIQTTKQRNDKTTNYSFTTNIFYPGYIGYSGYLNDQPTNYGYAVLFLYH